MNLITDPWIPVIRKSGIADVIAPFGLWDNDVPVRLNWPRADFDVACLELLIGLCYAADPPEDNDEWNERSTSHKGERWKSKLHSLSPWFDLDAEKGPRFMQDFEELTGGALPLDRLLIDAPGENSIKNNTDHFCKRTDGMVLSRAIAAMLLYTFQTFAPSGGAGHRTSLRGGGPMVTLIEPNEEATLYEIVWANVPVGEPLPLDDEDEIARAFPWVAPTITSEKKTGTQVHMYDEHGMFPHWGVFFGMPRRIRLKFGSSNTICELGGNSDDKPVTAFVQQTYGTDYGMWVHPTSPYYQQKNGSEKLPVHPKPGNFGYQNYQGIVLRSSESQLRYRATCVDTWANIRGPIRVTPRLLVAGWALDNMKALDFTFSRLPVPVTALSKQAENTAVSLIEAAEILAKALVSALRDSLKVDAKSTDAATAAKKAFYQDTEAEFAKCLGLLKDEEDTQIVSEYWRKKIFDASLRLFDNATQPLIPNVSPERAQSILKARRLIQSTALGYSAAGKKMFNLLSLETPEKPNEKRRKRNETSNTSERSS